MSAFDSNAAPTPNLRDSNRMVMRAFEKPTRRQRFHPHRRRRGDALIECFGAEQNLNVSILANRGVSRTIMENHVLIGFWSYCDEVVGGFMVVDDLNLCKTFQSHCLISAQCAQCIACAFAKICEPTRRVILARTLKSLVT